MRLIAKIDVLEAMINSHSVPEDEYPLWSAGSYDTGDTRIHNHRVFESVQDANTDEPVEGGLTPWLDLGPTNSRRCFDDGDNTPTTHDDDIVIELEPGELIGAVGLVSLLGAEASVEMEDPVEGVVYSETKGLIQSLGPIGPHTFCFGRRRPVTDVVFLDLPAYPDAVTTMTVTAGTAGAQLGECVIGQLHRVGQAEFGMDIGLKSFSRIDEDPNFGTRSIVKRKTKRTRSFPVFIESKDLVLIDLVLRPLDGRPTVVIGNENRVVTIIYGLILRLRGRLKNAVTSNYSLEVEEL